MSATRETWVDAVKGLAILLVSASHGIQGLMWPQLVPVTVVGCAINEALYCFHFQLFFLCSGYLWQRYGPDAGWRGHLRAIPGKAWRLGVPYLAFGTLSWGLKTFCGRSVNHPAASWWQDLFVTPVAPYWFLPALVLLFALFPRVRGKKGWAVCFATAVLAKAATVAWDNTAWIFPVRSVVLQAFWFVAGTGLALFGTEGFRGRLGYRVAVACALLFLAGAVAATTTGLWWQYRMWWCKDTKWVFGVMAGTAVLAWAVRRDASLRGPGIWEWLGRNTLPIFLMHTIFSSAARIGLLALGVQTLWILLPAVLLAGIVGPLAAMRVLEWMHLDGLVDPRRWRHNHPERIGLSNAGVGR